MDELNEKKEYEGLKFSVTVKSKNMTDFVLHHNYTSAQGWIGIIISIGALVYLCINFSSMNMTTRGVLLVIGLLFTVINPSMLILKAKKQVADNPTFKTPINYTLAEEALVIEQGEQQSVIGWDQLRLIKESKHVLIVYVTKVRAFIWPKDQIDQKYKEISDLLIQKMGVSRVRLKNKIV